MPRIFDNIELGLLPALEQTLAVSERADFCVGFFNLRGWKCLDELVERWPGGDGHQCRLLVGMQRPPEEQFRLAYSVHAHEDEMSNQAVVKLKRKLAENFRDQLTIGLPTDEDEGGLRRLASQLESGKLSVKLFLRHPLHAKLYLCFRQDTVNPITGFVGSSNLTLAGLERQGELNVDVLDHDATQKLARWFEDRWTDRWCVDISSELIQIIQESWAREEFIPPYHIYLKMAYHLSQEARAGLHEFRLPRDFGNELFPFQEAAVKIAAHHLQKRRGVLIGDVVGLGKTLMATAVARIFEDDHGTETLIICPKNLVSMWDGYVHRYRLHAKILPISMASRELPSLRRYRVVILDESHNLRNREGKRFRAIQEYIAENESRCILLSATPYNKTYLDLSSQLRLFVPEDMDLGIRPERLLQEIGGETSFLRTHQAPVRSLAAFEKSEYPDDWRELMRLFMVRRTRTFIKQHYATNDTESGRMYITYADGTRSYFPIRRPKTVKFLIDTSSGTDPYARLYAPSVVNAVNSLTLPRYGLANYVLPTPNDQPTAAEARILEGLSRAGKRLMGFCRTNLFKRLESGGPPFIQSIERHILRNYVFLHALENGLPVPIGGQNAEMLDARTFDEDAESALPFDDDENGDDDSEDYTVTSGLTSEVDFRKRAADVYKEYTQQFKRHFKWLRPTFFVPELENHLLEDARTLQRVVQQCGTWDASKDAKLSALYELLSVTHKDDKVIVFTQFADTARYIGSELRRRGLSRAEAITGDCPNPTELAWRFSPVSNQKRDQVDTNEELRVLIATDVLSEGQNLQDGHIIVNYDLPWAIIRLVQRAGRVDRIGQAADTILCYSFLPADGIERIINLRGRVRQRLRENAEVVGADEAFFEDDRNNGAILDIYNEKAGILDGEDDSEVDLASRAYEIWNNATKNDAALAKTIESMPDVVYSTREHTPTDSKPRGVLVYVKTGEGNDVLTYVDEEGERVTQSHLTILQAAECRPDTPAIPRHPKHHELVAHSVEDVVDEEKSTGGQLGSSRGARFRTYERLKEYLTTLGDTRDLLITDDYVRSLERILEEIYRYPLRQSATDTLNRRLRLSIRDDELAELLVALREDGRLCIIQDEAKAHEPHIICSLGLFGSE